MSKQSKTYFSFDLQNPAWVSPDMVLSEEIFPCKDPSKCRISGVYGFDSEAEAAEFCLNATIAFLDSSEFLVAFFNSRKFAERGFVGISRMRRAPSISKEGIAIDVKIEKAKTMLFSEVSKPENKLRSIKSSKATVDGVATTISKEKILSEIRRLQAEDDTPRVNSIDLRAIFADTDTEPSP